MWVLQVWLRKEERVIGVGLSWVWCVARVLHGVKEAWMNDQGYSEEVVKAVCLCGLVLLQMMWVCVVYQVRIEKKRQLK